jgi:hypothetical protein
VDHQWANEDSTRLQRAGKPNSCLQYVLWLDPIPNQESQMRREWIEGEAGVAGIECVEIVFQRAEAQTRVWLRWGRWTCVALHLTLYETPRSSGQFSPFLRPWRTPISSDAMLVSTFRRLRRNLLPLRAKSPQKSIHLARGRHRTRKRGCSGAGE